MDYKALSGPSHAYGPDGKAYYKIYEWPKLTHLQMHTMLIASAKILEPQGSIAPSSFYGQLVDY